MEHRIHHHGSRRSRRGYSHARRAPMHSSSSHVLCGGRRADPPATSDLRFRAPTPRQDCPTAQAGMRIARTMVPAPARPCANRGTLAASVYSRQRRASPGEEATAPTYVAIAPHQRTRFRVFKWHHGSRAAPLASERVLRPESLVSAYQGRTTNHDEVCESAVSLLITIFDRARPSPGTAPGVGRGCTVAAFCKLEFGIATVLDSLPSGRPGWLRPTVRAAPAIIHAIRGLAGTGVSFECLYFCLLNTKPHVAYA
jgi:hypothetical protein